MKVIGTKGVELTREEMIALRVAAPDGSPVKQRGAFPVIEERAAVEPEADGAVNLSFSSEAPYERWFGIEILDHKAKSIRMGRMKQGLPLLREHDPMKMIGIVEKCAIKDARCVGVARFGSGPDAQQASADVSDKILRNTSVGYFVYRMVLEEDGDVPVYRATDWEPCEASLVAVAADPTVGIGRSVRSAADDDAEAAPAKKEDVPMEPQEKAVREPAAVEEPRIRVEEVESRARESERQRARAIREIGERHEMRELAEKAVDAGTSLEEFRKVFIEEITKRATPYNPDAPKRDVGMSRRELSDFSFMRLANALVDGRRTRCLELEACDEWAKKSGIVPSSEKAATIPPDVFYRAAFLKRDITDAAEGADMTQIEHASGMFIDVLRASNPILGMATVLDGLTGDVKIPRQATAVAASWETEVTAVDEGTPTFDQVLLTPNRVGAFIEATRRAMIQFTPSIEMLIRQDLLTAIALAIGTVAIKGGGANEPTGILGTAGIGSVLAGNSSCDWDVAVNLEREVDTDNALMGRISYLTNPLVRAQMKRTIIDAGSGQFVWDRQTPGAPVNGYPVAVSTLVPSNLGAGLNRSACIFGNFADLIIGLWDTMEIIVNPYSRDTEGIVRVTIQHEVDTDVRHAESFAAAQDIDHAV